MQRSLKTFTTLGILFTLIFGTLSHFFYEWSGNFLPVGLFSPVNETVWEHLKLVFFPSLLFMAAGQPYLSYRCPDFFCKNLIGLYAGLLTMPVLYYGYTLFTGQNYLWVDIATFILCVLVTFLLAHSLRKIPLPGWLCRLTRIVLFLLLGAFVLVSLYFMLMKTI